MQHRERHVNHPLKDKGLADRIVLVTGSGRGIGRGAAVGLARRGARLALLDVTDDELDRTVALARAEGAQVIALRADLRRRDEIDRALATLAGVWGPPDVLVNNAAVLHLKSFEETDPSVWDDTIRVNLEAAYYLTWRVYRHMLDCGRGHILSMSSNAGVRPFALETAYCAAKYGIEGLFRSLAVEAMAHGVFVVLCTPGKTTKPTSMTDGAFAALAPEDQSRYSGPEVFAEAFGYLAAVSDRAFSGRRFDLYALAELVREQGWSVPGALALQRAERDHV